MDFLPIGGNAEGGAIGGNLNRVASDDDIFDIAGLDLESNKNNDAQLLSQMGVSL